MDQQNSTRVMFFCRSCVVEASIALAKGARLTDYLLSADRFIAVADAVVKDLSGQERFRAAFLDIHRDTIEMALPAHSLHESPNL